MAQKHQSRALEVQPTCGNAVSLCCSPAPLAQFVEMLPTPLGAARDAIILKEAYLPTGEADDSNLFLKVC
jgi:hypothetical protein